MNELGIIGNGRTVAVAASHLRTDRPDPPTDADASSMVWRWAWLVDGRGSLTAKRTTGPRGA